MIITFIIRVICCFAIYSLFKSYSDTFSSGFWASVVMSWFMGATANRPIVEVKK